MIIPLDQLSIDTLNAIVESFVLREGTDYGDQEIDLADKIADVIRQLKQGKAVLVYSELYESVDIVPADKFRNNMTEMD